MLLFLIACLHQTPSTRAIDPDIAPILPSPEGQLYASGKGTPRDVAVAAAAVGLPWDESLSGAAGAMAMASDRPPEVGSARWAAYRAGYPYPIRTLAFAAVEPGASPTALLDALKAQLKPGDQLGLARARVGEEDRWVALLAHPARTVEPFPRQISGGGSLSLSGAGLTRYRLVSPTGKLLEGALPASPALDEAGEWWVELFSEDGRAVVSVPVSCGIPAAPAPPVDLPGRPSAGPDDATAELLRGLAQVRTIFDLSVMVPDDTLELVARQPLQDLLAGTWDSAAVAERVRKSGFADGAALSCRATTVPLCVDEWLRTGDGRQALLNPRWRSVGSDVRVDVAGVAIVLLLAPE